MPRRECPEGHAEEYHTEWGGERADVICVACQSFYDADDLQRHADGWAPHTVQVCDFDDAELIWELSVETYDDWGTEPITLRHVASGREYELRQDGFIVPITGGDGR